MSARANKFRPAFRQHEHRPRNRPLARRPGSSPYLTRLVEEGKLGMKSGEGFRKWTPEQARAVRERVARHLIALETILND